jgi:hypothetical protein
MTDLSQDMTGAAPPETGAPLYVPAEWTPPAPTSGRDVALDLLRGVGIVILVVNHLRLASPLSELTRAALSAAEVLVGVSGVVVGMVFGRRWLVRGARATTGMLLRRARKLYVASVVVVALVGAATFVPGLATGALTVSSRSPDLYGFDGPVRTAIAILTLEAGPWQFNILGFFIASLALAPVVLWALARGHWPWVLAASWGLYLVGRATGLEVLPSQSEWPFPLLVWQVLFINGAVLGWHRDAIASALRGRRGRLVCGGVVAAGLGFAALKVAGPHVVDGPAWSAWETAHLDKESLAPIRLLGMSALVATVYLGFRRYAAVAERRLGPVLLPLGRNSFYVFIMHVAICLAVASVRARLGADFGTVGNVLVPLACLGLLVAMVRRRFLFRWVPR